MNKTNRNILILIGIAIAIFFIFPKFNLGAPQGEIYSIAGTRWGCDALPYRGDIFSSGGSSDSYKSMAPNSAIVVNCDSRCGGTCLFDTFIDWEPQLESKNSVDFTCPEYASECQVQLYCCDHLDCSTNAQCQSWFGSGYECVSTSDTDPYIGFDWSSWSYCEPAEVVDHRCWRNVGYGCEEHSPPYTQQYLDTNFEGDCPPTWPYESSASCEGASSKTCAQWKGYKCTSSQSCEGNLITEASDGTCCNVPCTGISGCPSGQVLCDGVCKTSCGGSGTRSTTSSLTFVQYYSQSNIKVAKHSCLVDSDCLPKSGYTITCDKTESVTNRLLEANIDECEESQIGGLVGFVFDFVPWALTGQNLCEIDPSGSLVGIGLQPDLLTIFLASTSTPKQEVLGICIAKSESTFGKALESVLEAFAGFGLPEQYVLVVVILALVLIIGFVINYLK